MIFFERKNFVKCERNDTVLTIYWDDFGTDKLVKECCQAQLQQVKQGAQIFIVDTSHVSGGIRPETSQWVQDTIFPALESAGLKAIITVLSKDALARLTTRLWKNAGSAFRFDMYETGTLKVAYDLARELS